ncbi:type II toxin-antitoxin system Phd/YefM family antitoxin [Sporosarcina limicola]|uniref:Antitoxin n=1 Tax=Sporosarcina limicola TaxID=34101 RepID=A0A927MLP8_9BACL|nr:type II toxin-antitoxin system Phd/YefM family antitoxin [Sporosarcina limicola]MBE1555222.1 prevent-host-death family protein [Sporosarcina limicola]
MKNINATNARKDLFNLIRETNESSTPIEINSKNGDAILVSKSDWESIHETLYIYSVPDLTESILQDEASDEYIDSKDIKWDTL